MVGATSHTRKDAAILAALLEDYTNLLTNFVTFDQCEHSRVRVYPRTTAAADLVNLIDGLAANTFGAWTNLIPIGTITMPFYIIGFDVEVAPADTYMIQFASSATPTDVQIIGEGRFVESGIAVIPTAPIPIEGRGLPAQTGVWARIMSRVGNRTINISLKIDRDYTFIGEQYRPTLWPTWPW